MATSRAPEQSMEDQLEALRSVDAVESAQRVLRGVRQRVRWQRRQVIAAVFGACVSAIGAIHFTTQGDPIGFIGLTLSTAVLIFAAWQSASNALRLAALEPGASLLNNWRAELQRQLRHTLIAQLVAALFTMLTAWVVWRHGIPSLKSLLFLLLAAGVCTFAAYQQLVIRPSLLRELEVLKKNE